jgi:hypothetical protein
MGRDIEAHVREIDRCNQRGGRSLSVVDLLDAGTLDLELAAYLGGAILDGHSFMVGALPGGAGKTTVMGALLNFVPHGVALAAATEGVPASYLRGGRARTCLVCHEIGEGPYFAYLWGEDVRDFCKLPDAGHMAATNLHADDMAQARAILCEGCAVPERDFGAWPLFLFLALERRGRLEVARRIAAVWEGPARLVYEYDGGGRFREANAPRLGSAEKRARVRGVLERARGAGTRSLADVRAAVLAACDGKG